MNEGSLPGARLAAKWVTGKGHTNQWCLLRAMKAGDLGSDR